MTGLNEHFEGLVGDVFDCTSVSEFMREFEGVRGTRSSGQLGMCRVYDVYSYVFVRYTTDSENFLSLHDERHGLILYFSRLSPTSYVISPPLQASGIYSTTMEVMSKMTIRPDRYPRHILLPKNADEAKSW